MEDSNLFKKEFKYYKSKCPPPSYDNVLDLSMLNKEKIPPGLKPLTPQNYHSSSAAENFIANLMIPPSEWNVYEITDIPGLIFVKNPFTPIGQRYWIHRCLKDYTCKPHLLNLDGHAHTQLSQDWWQACQTDDKKSKILRKQLRWATLGYHHNWNTKVYSDVFKGPFPEDLAALSSYTAKIIGFEELFKAEAAIVNFYHFDSTLSGHVDHSEVDMTAPLFSFSFGQSAIFLLGGPTLGDKPVPIFIKSGDIVVMSGYSRQCYHGIPKVLPATETPWDHESAELCKFNRCSSPSLIKNSLNSSSEPEDSFSEILKSKFTADKFCKMSLDRNLMDEKYWEPFKAYINHSRINMNVRQVFPKNCASGI